jgi:alpha-amylase
MKKTICLYFQVHQPFRLKRYRFFDIGKDHSYYDEFSNRTIMRKVAERCYLPANNLMLELIKQHGKQFKVSYSISGAALEQFELYAPDVLESFKALAKTGCVEFLGETCVHSLASVLDNFDEFEQQVRQHRALVEKHFGQRPTVFRNTELIYSDAIGAKVSQMGFVAMLTEGAKHVLGWKSPNYVYANAAVPKFKVLLRNFRLSDDIAFRFSDRSWSEWPLTADKYVSWVNAIDEKEEVVNLFMDYETLGEHQWAMSGIFEFFRYLPSQILSKTNFEFLTPSETVKKHQPVAPIKVEYPISWADEERDLTAWLGNELQNEAFSKIYALSDSVLKLNKDAVLKEWRMLQNSDHFYYMSTKWFSDGDVHKYFNPYDSPYDAFINYMNVLSDFGLRLKNPAEEGSVAAPSLNIENSEAAAEKMQTTIMAKKEPAAKPAAKKPTPAKPAAKKAAPAKAATPAKKATPAKVATPVKKAAPAKAAPAKKAVPAKAAPAKKAVPAKAAIPAKKTTPAKAATPVKKTIPAKAATPVKKTTPAKAATPGKKTTPAKAATPAKKTTPAKAATPVKKAEPAKAATPAKKAAPAKAATPVKKVTPAKAATPVKKAAPAKAATPAKKATPAKAAVPAKKAAPAKKAVAKKKTKRPAPATSIFPMF